MKSKRTFSVTKIRLVLIAYVAFQYQNMMCILSTQLSFALGESLDGPQNFQDIDFTNITFVDMLARQAMEKLHDDLDRDDDGNVSLSEGAQYIEGQEKIKNTKNHNLPGFATDKDGRITEKEFWENWEKSAVHNWTVSQMVDWLHNEVGLPQYGDTFKQYGISGAAMPIFTQLDCEIWQVVSVKLITHRRKIHIRSTDIVLFGAPKSHSGLLKDILLTISLGLAIGGVMFAVHVQRKAALSVSVMQDKLLNLQKELQSIDDEDMWIKERDSFHSMFPKNAEVSSSNTSLESDSTMHSKLQEALTELADTKSSLEEAEERLKLNFKKWTPDKKLINCLKETYQVEIKFHDVKREEAQKKVEAAKSQFHKMKRRSGIFSSVQFIHSRQVDRFDLEVQTAKEALREVQHDSREHRKRWTDIEKLCSHKFTYKRKLSSPITISSSKKPEKVEKNEKVDKAASGEGSKSAISEVLPTKLTDSKPVIPHPASCPTLTNFTDQRGRRATEPLIERSSSATEGKLPLKAKQNSTPIIVEESYTTALTENSKNLVNNRQENNNVAETNKAEVSKGDISTKKEEINGSIKRTPSSVSTQSHLHLLKDSGPNSQSLPDLTIPKIEKKSSKSPTSVSNFKMKKGFPKAFFNSFRKSK